MPKRMEILTVFKAVDRMTRPISRFQRRMGRFTKAAERGLRRVGKVTNKVGNIMKRGLTTAIKGATVALAAFGAVAAKVIMTGAEFEKTLVSAAIKFPEKIKRGTAAYKKLEDAARLAGETTEFTASEAASALQFLAMAGFNASDSVEALPQVINLATASGMDLAEATDIATDSIGALQAGLRDTEGVGAKLARVNDLLAATTNSANLTVQEMFESIKAGGGTVTQAGASIETLGALLGTMANAGKKGEAAGTALRNMFLRLQAPVGAAKGLIKEYAGNIVDADGNMIDFVKIIERMNSKMKGLGGVQKAQIMDTIFGKKAIEAANIVFATGADEINKYRETLEKAAGSTSEVAGEIRDTMSGSIDSLKSAIEGVIIDLFKLEDDGIKGVVDGITAWIRENKKLITSKIGTFLKNIIENFDEIVSTAKKIGIAIGIVFTLITAIKGLIAVLTLVNLVMAANPVVLAILAIVAVVAFAVGAIIANWDDIKYFFMELWRFLTNIAKAFWDGMVYAALSVAEKLQEIWVDFKNFFVDLWSGIVDTVENAWNKIAGFVGNIIGGVKAAIGFAKSLISMDDKSTASVESTMVSPAERVARNIEERNMTTTNRSEVTIRDESGRAVVTQGELGAGLTLEPTGTF